MNIEVYIASGILELYCMGTLSGADAQQVENNALQYPEVAEEISRIRQSLENYASHHTVKPKPQTKVKLFNDLYRQDAGPGRVFPPFIDGPASFNDVMQWVNEQHITSPGHVDPAHLHDLAGDPFVTNFLAWVKHGHPEEIHDNYHEYLVILEGACTMTFEDRKQDFKQGDIISIPMHVRHTATVTSAEPMLALVQRQFIA